AVPIEMLKFTFVTSSTFSCLIAELIWVRFSAGGAAVAAVAALPTVLLSEVEGLVSAVGVFRSFEVVVESDAFVLPSAFISPVVVLFSEVDGLVSAVGFFMSFEVVVG